MDGIHDLGGREGFGPVLGPGAADADEDWHHADWELRTLGVVRAMVRPGDWTGDWFRHCRELIDPVDYLTRPYFDQWLQAYAAMLVEAGIATVDEVASGRASGPAPGLPEPMRADDVPRASQASVRFDREPDAPPAYSVGDAVRCRAHGARGHTRLPAYVRGRSGEVTACHGAHVLPDASAHGEPRAETLYTVAFDAGELWPEAGSRRDRVYLDLWESYLET